MYAEEVQGRLKAKRSDFNAALAEEFIWYVDVAGHEESEVQVDILLHVGGHTLSQLLTMNEFAVLFVSWKRVGWMLAD